MKFGKRLRSQIDEMLPEWQDKFLCYKQLKKRLKLVLAAVVAASDDEASKSIPTIVSCEEGEGESEYRMQALSPDSAESGASSSVTMSSSSRPTFQEVRDITLEELDFIRLLDAELEKLNSFFTEKEEDYVIHLQELKERIEKVKKTSVPDDGASISENELNMKMIEIRKDFVKFHGEMVLLENYSSLNYTGLVKILKKHDKLTGVLLRMPFIQNVLRQPFFTTELLSKLVHECETTLHSIFPSSLATTPNVSFSPQEEHSEGATTRKRETEAHGKAMTFFQGEDFEKIYKGTMAALKTIRELRKGSSMHDILSMAPPGQNKGDGDIVEDGNPSATCYMSIPICPKR